MKINLFSEGNKMQKMKKIRFGYWIPLIFCAVCLALFIRLFVLVPLQVEGDSMEPTLHNRDEVLVRHFGKIKRFDIVVIKMPSGETYIKRVIGLPGEKIEYKDDKLYVDGKYIPEKFLEPLDLDTKQTYTSDFTLKDLLNVDTVPEGRYFVLGDNRRISKDSRTFGAVKTEWIQGQAVLTYWPLKNFSWL